MSSRDSIIDAIRKAKPAAQKKVLSILVPWQIEDLQGMFITSLEKVGATCLLAENREQAITLVPPSPDTTIITSELGVAENGAIWVTDKQLTERVAPFVCEHLVVLLNSGGIVSTMHHAYEKIGLEDYGFGVFISGPSKTADIEQSLVKGAHGPRLMTVVLVRSQVM